jgi:hypothetical protein
VGTEAFFPGVKQLTYEFDHSSPSREGLRVRGAMPTRLRMPSFCSAYLCKRTSCIGVENQVDSIPEV